MTKKTCFVVMGFGEKPDLATGRTLDLDKTYRIIIKRAVEDAGLECIRADDVIHAGLIEKPMYELLLSADVVVADLSTSNANALYELGVRHALRPYTTIVIAEKEFKFPFDLKSLLIRPYEHLGKGIDAEEAERVCTELTAALKRLLDQPEVDSPVHSFLPNLSQTTRGGEMGGAATSVDLPPPGSMASSHASDLLELFRECRATGDWSGAIRSLKRLIEHRPNDAYVTQQLALATYKSKRPDAITALLDAHAILQKLDPARTTDPETLGLWGAVHKRLWEVRSARSDLDEAIWAYEKGFYLNNDYYTGINLAFLLNVRASVSSQREANADAVIAERVRRRVIDVCEQLRANLSEADTVQPDLEQQFWVIATLAEAYVGIGNSAAAAEIEATATALAPESWMVDSMKDQLAKLESLL